MAYNNRGGYGGRSYGQRYSKPAVVAPADKPRLAKPSSYQVTIFESVRSAGLLALRNIRAYAEAMRSWRPGKPMPEEPAVIGIHVNALAGTGKTSTSVEKDFYLPEEIRKDSIQVAFNSAIAGVLAQRVAPGVEAKTIHALGRAAVVAAFRNLNRWNALDTKKYIGYIQAELGREKETMVARENLRLMMDRARDALAWTSAEMSPILDRFEMETGHLSREKFLSLAEKILAAGINDTGRLDYGDMIAMPVYHNLQMRRYSALSVDEYQDLCPAQHELLDRSVKPGGLMFTVGDANQAIYLWRSADIDSIEKGIARYNSECFPLPRTYRCGLKIVERAQEYVPELEAKEDAHDGEVIDGLPIDKLIDEANIGDAILSRLNAPLLKICFAFIRAGVPANIKGRDVGENLKFMIKRSSASTVDALLAWVDQWAETEVSRRETQKKPIDIINDTAECLHTLCEGRYEIAEVVAAIDELFPVNMPERIVLLSSIHRAKGEEYDNVFLLQDTLFLKRGDPQEERNLAYVGITRAKHKLTMVSGR